MGVVDREGNKCGSIGNCCKTRVLSNYFDKAGVVIIRAIKCEFEFIALHWLSDNGTTL